MNRGKRILLVAMLTGIGLLLPARAQIRPGQEMYAITGGTYVELGGFVGSLTVRVPNRVYAYIQLEVAPSGGTADLTVRSQDWRTTRWHLTNGVVAGDAVYFHYVVPHPVTSSPATNDYTVTVREGSLAFEGAMTSAPECCDIPYLFGHSNVVAVAVPQVSAAVSTTSSGALDLCWTSKTNLEYQVQFHSGLSTGAWVDLGPPVTGISGSCRASDNIPSAERHRFYRILVRPKTP